MVTITVTGITGGLNSKIIKHLSQWATSNPTSKINLTGTTRSPSKLPPSFKSSLSNVTIHEADFDQPSTLTSAFTGTSIALIISTPTKDIEQRSQQHRNAIDAAIAANVPWVLYTSLGMAHGYRTTSKVDVMQAHLATEEYIKEKSAEGKLQNYTIVRQGIYADAFPLFLNWFPDTKEITLPGNRQGKSECGRLAWATRDELAEGNARLLWLLAQNLDNNKTLVNSTTSTTPISPYRNATILLSGPKAYSLRETASIISKYTGNPIDFNIVSVDNYVKEVVAQGKPEWIARFWATLYSGLQDGEAELVVDTLETLLERKATGVEGFIKSVVGREGGYRWHQQG